MTIAAIIVAAGTGQRLGGDLPKQFLDLGGVPLLARTVWAFDRTEEIDRILVALPESYLEHARREVFQPIRWRLDLELLAGGEERSDSVGRCLDKLEGEVDHVIVHDGARPLVTSDLVRQIVAGLASDEAVIAGVAEKNTLKRLDGRRFVAETVDRTDVVEAQTPQGFRLDLLRRAHDSARSEGAGATDDSVLVERLGQPVRVIQGEETNLKVTTEFDLMLARCLLPLIGQEGEIVSC